jgi:NAD(P)-dependent dehydrogenase (short-subunit alcohol dehydrogenase family)
MNNPFDFSGKVAIVTGAAAGMGLATANAFAEAGAAVVLADYKEDVVKAAAERSVAAGHKAIAVRCDVSDDAQVEAMVERTVADTLWLRYERVVTRSLSASRRMRVQQRGQTHGNQTSWFTGFLKRTGGVVYRGSAD